MLNGHKRICSTVVDTGQAPERGKTRPALREALAQGAVALTDRVFAAIDRAKARRLMDAMDERGRADIGWRRDRL